MTSPKPPVHVEILVDGKRIHSMHAERVTSSQDRQSLTLEATAWHPDACTLPPNPALPDLGAAAAILAAKTGTALLDPVRERQFTVAVGRPLSADEKAKLARALDTMTKIVRTVDQIVSASVPPVRGTCPECASGAHHCTADACYCGNPHRCSWTRTDTTIEGTTR